MLRISAPASGKTYRPQLLHVQNLLPGRLLTVVSFIHLFLTWTLQQSVMRGIFSLFATSYSHLFQYPSSCLLCPLGFHDPFLSPIIPNCKPIPSGTHKHPTRHHRHIIPPFTYIPFPSPLQPPTQHPSKNLSQKQHRSNVVTALACRTTAGAIPPGNISDSLL